ncbi:MAG TPA: hypothetical protein VKP67_27720, partial [Xanthobacteraceae bacterium]|nr:hypothetical protein [Xanthobacteraceae bacterium]
ATGITGFRIMISLQEFASGALKPIRPRLRYPSQAIGPLPHYAGSRAVNAAPWQGFRTCADDGHRNVPHNDARGI